MLRTGDFAPVPARVSSPASFAPASLPDGALVFVPDDQSALYLFEGGSVRTLVNIGDTIPACGTVRQVNRVATGADGTIAVMVACFGVQAILRVNRGDGSLEVALHSGMTLPIGGTPATVFFSFDSPAVDGQGRIVAAANGGADLSALVRQSGGSAPEVLIATGDPLGAGAYRFALRAPRVNTGGTVVFSAVTTLDTEVIATLVPGSTPTVLFSVPIVPPSPPQGFAPQLALAPPVINDAGDVAFRWWTQEFSKVQRIAGGVVETVATEGSPAPGGGALLGISQVEPQIDAAGGVFFGALSDTGVFGIYRVGDSITRVAEDFDDTGAGETLNSLCCAALAPPLPGSVEVHFASRDTAGGALFTAREGTVGVQVRGGAPMDEPARFIDFRKVDSGSPYLSTGPFMSPGGNLIFDARISGGSTGLFARDPDGSIVPVALDGDPAPGAGHFNGLFFSFHSINDAGLVAFLGIASDGPGGFSPQIFSGSAGGALRTIVAGGDVIAGFDAPVSSVLPPSPINAAGAIAVPVVLADSRYVLLAWDGTALTPIVATGDSLPDGEVVTAIQTGWSRALLTPLLDDAGGLVVGFVTAAGHRALYHLSLPLGLGSAIRVLGDGEPVEGDVLDPFFLNALAADATGRLVFQTAPAPGPGAATYSRDLGPVARRVIRPGDTLGDLAVVSDVRPRLAATANGGVVHEVSVGTNGRRLLYATPKEIPAPGDAFDEHELIGVLTPSPDGGYFLDPAIAGARPGVFPRNSERLGSDGDRFVVAFESTSVNVGTIVLFDLRPNRPPVAMGGSDQTIECTGPAGASVTLDASASVDPEGGALEYTWTGPFGTATGVTPTVIVPLGTWTIDLTITDAEGATSLDSLVVTVRDTVAPTLAVRAAPDRIWPPDGRMRQVFFAVTTRDLCDPRPRVTLDSITSNDPKFDPAADVSGAAYGTDDRVVFVSAKRTGGIGGRLYTAAFTSTDGSGNGAGAAASVLVPQSNGNLAGASSATTPAGRGRSR